PGVAPRDHRSAPWTRIPSFLSGTTRKEPPNLPGSSCASNGAFGRLVTGFTSPCTQTPALSVVNSIGKPGRTSVLSTTIGMMPVGWPVLGSIVGGAFGAGGEPVCLLRELCGAVLTVEEVCAAAEAGAAACADGAATALAVAAAAAAAGAAEPEA